MTTLDHLAKLEAAATPGPWKTSRQIDGSVNGEVFAPDGHEFYVDVSTYRYGEDAALIAATRNALPALLAVARAAEAVRHASRFGFLVGTTREREDALDTALAELARVTL